MIEATFGVGFAKRSSMIGGMVRDDALRILRQHQAALAALGVRHAYLFGSVARDEADDSSDVDLMVDLDEGVGGRKPLFSAFDVGGIRYELAQILGRSVDLMVRQDALRAGQHLKTVAERQLVAVF